MWTWPVYANAFVAASALLIVWGLLWLWNRTKAQGFIWKASAFGWIALCRILLVAEVHPFVVYSAQVALPFYVLFGIGLVLTISKLRSVYQTMTAPVVDVERQRIAEAEELVRQATEAAAVAAQVISDAAAAALRAKEHTLEVMRLARQAGARIKNGGEA